MISTLRGNLNSAKGAFQGKTFLFLSIRYHGIDWRTRQFNFRIGFAHQRIIRLNRANGEYHK